MFNISRETILTTTNKGKFLREKCLPLFDRRPDSIKGTLKSAIAFAKKAKAWVADSENKALGLAAPQVGSKLQWFVMNFSDGSTKIIIQPKIIGRSGYKQFDEACFSEPGIEKRVKRARAITVHYFEAVEIDGKDAIVMNKRVQLEGRDAQVFQHEYDHLQGRLIVDAKKTRERGKKDWF